MKPAANKAGAKTVRVNPRFPEATAKRLKEASAIREQSVAAFNLETVSREAERVLAEERYWNPMDEPTFGGRRAPAKMPRRDGMPRA